MSTPITFPRFKAFVQGTNAPLIAGAVYFYVAGTSTPQNTYTDGTLLTANANPVILDANGEASIWPAVGASYKIVIKDSGGVTQSTTDNWSAIASPLSVSGHNYLINGSFELWQSGTSFTGATSQFLCDGWAINQNTGSGTITDYTMSRQSSGRSGSRYCLRIARTAASTALRASILVQNMETIDAVNIQGQQLAVSFWIRSGANYSSGNLSAQLIGGTGTDESFHTGLTFTGGTSLGVSSAITPSTTWTQYTFNVPSIATTVTEAAFIVTFGTSSGTAGAADYIEIDDVQIELGITPTPFERETADVVLRRAQRRYFKTFPQATAPAQNAGVTGAFTFPQVVAASTAMVTPTLYQPTWMREAAGTVTFYNPSAANAQARNTTVSADCSSTTAVTEAANGAYATLTAAAGSATGNVNRVHYVIDRRI